MVEAVILDFPGACLRAVVGLLNAGGGRLRVISMEDREPRRVRTELCQGILPEPSSLLDCAVEGEGNTRALAITVRPGKRRPYFLAEAGQARGAWRWQEDTPEPVLMEEDDIREAIRECDGPDYDGQRSLCQSLTHNGLRHAFLSHGLPLGMPQRVALGLVNGDGLYTNLAWITSDQRSYRMQFLWIEGVKPTGRVRERTTVQGCFSDLPLRAGAELRRMLRKRAEAYGILAEPTKCSTVKMGEALCQILQLLDFDGDGELRFCLYDDRLEAEGAGGPTENVAMIGERLGASACRNKRLLRVLERLMTSSRHTAFVPPPDMTNIRFDDRRFRMVVFRGEGNAASAPAIGYPAGSRAAKALALMQGKPYVEKLEVAESLELTLRQACQLLNRLEKDGLLTCLIPNSLYRLETDVYCPSPLGGVHVPVQWAAPVKKQKR